ncbi:MAG: lysophospholipid acyltransferase family protein [Deltaproteobacteria bacterium]|nr:lysophospholipid acyltransferase family protein [Deltaproteobacteria bacterium]
MKLFLSKLLAFVGAYLIYFYGKSLRVVSFNEKEGGYPVLYAHWHQDIIPAVAIFCTRKLKICTMASLSTDGEIITQFLNTLRFKVVRGSQAKRGRAALEEMIPWIQNGYHGALAVDGSRGPKYVVKKGIIKLAQDTSLPIIAGIGSFKWKYSFSSWDQMVLPIPFSKGVVFYSDPVYVSKDSTDEELENKRLEVENALTTLKNKAESYWEARLP